MERHARAARSGSSTPRPPSRGDPGAESNTPSDTAAIESPVKGEKLCVNCGKNVSGHRRVKDSRGYLCYACAKAERAAEREGKVRCMECRKMIRPEGLVAYNGKM